MTAEMLAPQSIRLRVCVVSISGSDAQGFLEAVELPPDCKKNGTALICKRNKRYTIRLELEDRTSSGLMFSDEDPFYADEGFECPPDGSTGFPDAFSDLQTDEHSLSVEYRSRGEQYSYGLKFDGRGGSCYFDPIIINRF